MGRPPVHVYEKPQAQAPQQSYGASARVETYKAPPKPAPSRQPPQPSYPSISLDVKTKYSSGPAKSQYSGGANRYKATKKSDVGLNNIFTGAAPPSSEPRAKLEEIQAPDLSPAGSKKVYSAPVAQARIDTEDRDKDRSAVVPPARRRCTRPPWPRPGSTRRTGTRTDLPSSGRLSVSPTRAGNCCDGVR